MRKGSGEAHAKAMPAMAPAESELLLEKPVRMERQRHGVGECACVQWVKGLEERI